MNAAQTRGKSPLGTIRLHQLWCLEHHLHGNLKNIMGKGVFFTFVFSIYFVFI